MKSEYFNKRSQSTQLRGQKEKPQSKSKPKQINWDRIVYFASLIVGLGYLFYYIFINTFYVEGEGLVVTETIKVQAPLDIKIQEQLVSNDSYVVEGDPLFRYTFINWDGTIEKIEAFEEDIVGVEERIREFEDDITLKRQSIQENQEQIAFLEQEMEDFQEKIRLNAATPYELNEVESSLFTARANLRRAQSELNLLINTRNRHIEKKENLASEIQELQSDENRLQTYHSPVSGIVSNILVQENQQAFRSDHILSINPNNAEVYIFSVFDREDGARVQPGTVMNIEFDNGAKSTGVIRSNYDARGDLIEHFERTGTLITDYLVVELVPPDLATRVQWLRFDRSGLTVFRRKIGKRSVDSASESTEGQLNTTDDTEKKSVVPEPDSIISNPPDWISSVKTSTTDGQNPDDLVTVTSADAGNANEPTEDNEPYGLFGESFNSRLDGYTINLHSLEDRQRASDISSEIKKQGYRVDFYPVTIEQKEYWRVAVGQFRTIEDALAAAETLPSSLGEDSFIYRIQ